MSYYCIKNQDESLTIADADVVPEDGVTKTVDGWDVLKAAPIEHIEIANRYLKGNEIEVLSEGEDDSSLLAAGYVLSGKICRLLDQASRDAIDETGARFVELKAKAISEVHFHNAKMIEQGFDYNGITMPMTDNSKLIYIDIKLNYLADDETNFPLGIIRLDNINATQNLVQSS